MSAEAPTVLFGRERIAERVRELARRISADYAGVDSLVLVGVLKGAFIFLADLSRELGVPRTVDFVVVATYGDSAVPSGNVRLILDLRTDVRGRHVLLVDDILDTGNTLRHLGRILAAHEPASLKTCVLVRKRKPRSPEVAVDYVGFDIEDVWVVGYGLDFADRHRTLPYIGVVEPR